MLKLEFPHIPRKITASLFGYIEKIMLWSLLSAFLMVNLYARANLLPEYWPNLNAALSIPGSLPLHEGFAQALWNEGLLAQAKQELLYAGTITQRTGNEGVLGVSTPPADILNTWENEPMKLTNELLYWQGVVKSKPDYRDGYIAAASLAYQLGKNDEAKNYLKQIFTLDPDNAIAQKILGILGK